MKKIFYLFLMCTVISYMSCDSLLEEDVSSFLSAKVIYSNDGGTQSALLGCYEAMVAYNYLPSGYANLLSAASTALYTQHAESKDLLKMEALSTNKYLNDCYYEIYKAIVRCNDVIDKVQSGGASQEVKDRVEAEARLLRAICYFNVVRMVGGVPLRLTPTTTSTLNLPRGTKEEVYEAIIGDLEIAKTGLPENPEKGFPGKYAAYALLAKVYIFLADGTEGSPYWEKALTEAKAVYGKYSLVRLDEIYHVANRNTDESIIEFQMSTAVSAGNYWTRMIAPEDGAQTPVATSNPYGRIRVGKYLFDTFRAQYPDDPRIDASFIYGIYPARNGGADIYSYPIQEDDPNPSVSASTRARRSFPYIKKFLDPTFKSSGTSANFIYLRYSDILLILAEAENEVNGPTNAYRYVNEVLARARNEVSPSASQPADWSGMTKEEFRKRIMYERLYELVGEQQEFFDLRRRGAVFLQDFFKAHNAHPHNIYEAANVNYSDVKYPEDLSFATKALLLPFPQNEINTNGALTNEDQNPGY